MNFLHHFVECHSGEEDKIWYCLMSRLQEQDFLGHRRPGEGLDCLCCSDKYTSFFLVSRRAHPGDQPNSVLNLLVAAFSCTLPPGKAPGVKVSTPWEESPGLTTGVFLGPAWRKLEWGVRSPD